MSADESVQISGANFSSADPNEALDRYEALVLAEPKTPEERLAALPGAIDEFENAVAKAYESEAIAHADRKRTERLENRLADLLAGAGTVVRKGVAYRREAGSLVTEGSLNLDDPTPAEARP